MAILDQHQQQAFDYILSHLPDSTTPRYFYVAGFAGVGKTRVMNALIEGLPDSFEPVALTWSGMAARQLKNASTIMSYCGLSFAFTGLVGDNAYMRDREDLQNRIIGYLRKRKDLFKKTPVLLLDEIGAIHDSVMDALSGAFKAIVPGSNPEEPFGGIPVVLSGDPCQIGRVDFYEKSPAYPPKDYPTYPCWQSATWKRMAPQVLYLQKFHRGGGEDIAYLEMLAELRTATQLSPGVPALSPKGLGTLQKIRDRDGGKVVPRFPHVIVCLTNREVYEHNSRYLTDLSGDLYSFPCIDTEHGPTPARFNRNDVQKMGYPTILYLKKGCRVMATVNDEAKRFANGMMGTVQNVTAFSGDPVVTVLFDDNTCPVEIRRATFIVQWCDGATIFSRKQIPLAVCAAMTAHKLVGATLDGVWLQLPFKAAGSDRDEDIIKYWSRQWLCGAMYTALSRVGSSSQIRVHSLRRTSDPTRIDPIFFMDPIAADFDRACRQMSLLQPLPDLSRDEDTPPQDTTVPVQSPTQESSHLSHGYDDVVSSIASMGKEICNRIEELVLSQQYVTNQMSVNGRYINPVVYCMMRPELHRKVATLTALSRSQFYQRLDTMLNLTQELGAEGQVDTMVDEMIREERRETNSNSDRTDQEPIKTALDPTLPGSGTTASRQPRYEDRPSPISGADDSLLGSSTPLGAEEGGAEELVTDGVDGHIENDMEDDDSDLSDTELHEDSVVGAGKGSGPGDDRFSADPFVIFKGHIYTVLKRYLALHPYLRFKDTSLEKMKTAHKRCILECKRTVSCELKRREPAKGSKPDWRLWPTHTCRLSEILVCMEGYRCFFYPLKSVPATQQDWRNHDKGHPHGTAICRSAYLPPDVVDYWAELLHTTPSLTIEKLREKADERYMVGGFCDTTMQFIANKGLNKYSKVRGVYRSLKENGKGGLNLDDFIEQIRPLRVDGDSLKETMVPVLASLRAVEASSFTEADLLLAREADRCIILDDILCEKSVNETGRCETSQLSMIFTSARMLRNLEECKTIGIDATYNIIFADVVITVVCALSRQGAAYPVALCLMRRETSKAVSHLLQQLLASARALDLRGFVPCEVVMDGSPSLNSGVKDALGEEIRIISCYYHVKQRAKKAKATARLSPKIWSAINKDIDLIGDAWSRAEWQRLKSLFLSKWKDDTPGRLTTSEKEAVATFLDEMKGYLQDDDWRSQWGRYSSEIAGPRTNNGVERFHSELKKTILTSRYRRTLADFGCFVKSPGSWMQISQYGRLDEIGGTPSQNDRRTAAQFFEKDLCSVVPRSWTTSYGNDTEQSHYQWIFLTSQTSKLPEGFTSLRDLVFSPEGSDVKKLALSDYSSLDEARDLKNKYCLVAYRGTPDWQTPPPTGPWCSCIIWGSRLVCPHVVCVSYMMKSDNSAEAKEHWKYIRTFLSRPPNRRGKKGRIATHAMADNVRYGLNEPTISSARGRKRTRDGNE